MGVKSDNRWQVGDGSLSSINDQADLTHVVAMRAHICRRHFPMKVISSSPCMFRYSRAYQSIYSCD